MADHRTALQKYALGTQARLGPETHASIVLRRVHTVSYVGSTDAAAAYCDEVEVAAGEGPCITAMQELRGVLIPDITTEERWPEWRKAALTAGFVSAAALPGYVDAQTTLAVDLYSAQPDPWEPERLVALDQYVQEIAEAVRTSL